MAYRWDEEAQITIDENFRSEVCARMLTFKDGGDKMEDKKTNGLCQPILFLHQYIVGILTLMLWRRGRLRSLELSYTS